MPKVGLIAVVYPDLLKTMAVSKRVPLGPSQLCTVVGDNSALPLEENSIPPVAAHCGAHTSSPRVPLELGYLPGHFAQAVGRGPYISGMRGITLEYPGRQLFSCLTSAPIC